MDNISSGMYSLMERLFPICRSITGDGVRETLNITSRAYLLYEGKILKEGTAKELISDEDAKRLYLGNTFVDTKES